MTPEELEADWIKDRRSLAAESQPGIVAIAQKWHSAYRKAQNSNLVRAQEIEKQATRIQELEAVLKEADQYRRASLDRVMKIANQRDDLKTLNDALMENGNDLRARAQKAEARIRELEASLAEAERLIRKNADMINGYLARIAKLEAQVAALREIVVEERAEQIYPYTWPLWENLPEDEFERTIIGSEKKTVMRGKNGYRQMAREQLQAEHPGVFQ